MEQHKLIQVEDRKGYDDGLDPWQCSCGEWFHADEVDEAFQHGQNTKSFYVIVEGGLARVVDNDGQERDDVLVIDWDVIKMSSDLDELRDIRTNINATYHAKDRTDVLGEIDNRITTYVAIDAGAD